MEVTQNPAAGLNGSSDPCKIPQVLEAYPASLYNINIPTVKSKKLLVANANSLFRSFSAAK